MLRFYAAPFFHAVTFFEHANASQIAGAILGETDEKRRAEFVREAGYLAGVVQTLPLSGTLKSLAYDIAHPFPGQSDESLNDMVGRFQQYMDRELDEHVFLCIPKDEGAIYKDPGRWFGETSMARFEKAKGDIEDCGRCLALEQWTASVFHAMRIAEHGLRDVARRLKVSFPDKAASLAQWQEIIDRIVEQTRAIRGGTARNVARRKRADFFAGVATHFVHIKDAWRNHVSHSRKSYGRLEALRIVENVRGFMEILSA